MESQSIENKLDSLLEKVDSLCNTVQTNGLVLKSLSEKLCETQAENGILRLAVNISRIKQDNLEKRVSLLENEEYRCRIKFINVAERKDENPKRRVFDILESIGITLDERSVIYAFREGRYDKRRTRAILVRFHHPADRTIVWKSRESLTKPIHLRQDFPEAIATKRRVLQQIVNRARDLREYKDGTYLRQDRLIINGKSYDTDSLYDIPRSLQTAVGCRQEEDVTYFYGLQSPLSNFYPTPIVMKGLRFNCVEQAFFFAKSEHYFEPLKGAEIMAETRPSIQKSIGESFGRKDWGDPTKPLTVMASIVMEKFKQSRYLARVLVMTGDTILAESNPHDSYWGTGKTTSEAIEAHNVWEGNNAMGEILADIRKILVAKLSGAPVLPHHMDDTPLPEDKQQPKEKCT